MRSGIKDRLITIESRSTTKSATGVRTDAWATYKVIHAAVKDNAASETYGGDHFTTNIMTSFKIDYFAGLNPKDYRIKYRDRVYNIRGVKELGRNETLEIMAEAQY